MIPVERTIVPHVIGEQVLATFTRAARVRDAAATMAERRIGAVLVVEDGRLLGIFTERDVVTRVVATSRDPDTTTLGEVMTADPDTIGPDDSVALALERMSEAGYRHLPVVDRARLVGIVSIRDLHRSVKDQMEADIILLAESLVQG
ncbi:MAG: CBS domain-containing protein [Alphaproteobacteria bacterium]|nr:CBS domain-containing protein [Alphaproteobacteria bacterium]